MVTYLLKILIESPTVDVKSNKHSIDHILQEKSFFVIVIITRRKCLFLRIILSKAK